MDRRDFLKVTGCGISALALSGLSILRANGNPMRPNILFIMSDDHAQEAISCYGGIYSQIMKTHNIDRIANEGVKLNNCMVTNSICTPSRATILTGKYGHLNGTEINYILFDGSQQTAPKLLQETGYHTAMIGKWHLRGKPTGFDYWHILPGQGRYHNPDFMEMNLERKRHEGYVTDLETKFAIDWLDQKWDRKRPFFMMCHHKAPHEAWEPAPEDFGKLNDVEIPEPKTLWNNHATKVDCRRKAEVWPIWPLLAERMSQWGPRRRLDIEGLDHRGGKKKAYEHYLKAYLETTMSLDRNIGRLLGYLEKEGILDETLVIYTSDNGMFLGEHGWYDKRLMYEEALKIPFVARYPAKIKPGTVSNKICLNLDFAETFLDYAKAEMPSDMQGRSLRPVLEGKEPDDWRTSMLYLYYEDYSHYGVRTDRYKLICYTDEPCHPEGEYELYDLQQDPYELNNVYEDSVYAETRRILHEEIKKLRQKYNVKDQYLPGPKWRKLNNEKWTERNKKLQV